MTTRRFKPPTTSASVERKVRRAAERIVETVRSAAVDEAELLAKDLEGTATAFVSQILEGVKGAVEKTLRGARGRPKLL